MHHGSIATLPFQYQHHAATSAFPFLHQHHGDTAASAIPSTEPHLTPHKIKRAYQFTFNQYALSDRYIQGPFLAFFLPFPLLCFFHFSFVLGTVTSILFIFCNSLLFLSCTQTLFFFCSLFICTSMEELFCFCLCTLSLWWSVPHFLLYFSSFYSFFCFSSFLFSFDDFIISFSSLFVNIFLEIF